MSVGEVITAIIKYGSGIWTGDGNDYLVLCHSIDCIDIKNDRIELYFTDYNTANVAINMSGHRIEYLQ